MDARSTFTKCTNSLPGPIIIAPGLPIRTIYRGVIPFVLIQITALLLVICVPSVALWLTIVLR